MKRLAIVLTVVVATASLCGSFAKAAGLYFTQGSNGVTIVAREADNSATYWQMRLYESGMYVGIITHFQDLRGTVATGFSDPAYNYVDHYQSNGGGEGLFQPLPGTSCTYTGNSGVPGIGPELGAAPLSLVNLDDVLVA